MARTDKAIAEMAKAMKARAEQASPPKVKPEIAAPPPEQMGDNVFRLQDVTDKRNGAGSITIGKAYRRRPMIDILAEQNLLTESEYKALKHYRHHADICDRSLMRDSLDKSVRGGSDRDGPTLSRLTAERVVAAVESAAGSLVDILRAVVVDDVSLNDWAIAKYGAISEKDVKRGKAIVRIRPKPEGLGIARVDIKMAAKRVTAELDA